MLDDALLTGVLESTNEPCAIAEIASISSLKVTIGNIAQIIGQLCQVIYMDRTITIIWKVVM
jgi:hypothetical protein